jgi:phosphatidylserine/phosphatidylglycerophosphate/cardiolipin synthase-like enzyme
VAVERFWVEPEAGVAPVVAHIRSARSTLDVVVYLLTNKEVIAELVAAHRAGVRVRVMVEEDPFGGGSGNKEALAALGRAGVPWRYGNPTYRYTHQKTILADRKRALVMTANLTKSAFTRNREFLGLLTAPAAVAEAQALFDADWKRTRYVPRVPGLVVSDTNSRERLVGLIRGARRSLEIHAEVMSDREVRDALIEAQRRGVRVRLLMSRPEPEETSHRALAELSAAGVGVRVIGSPYIHAKSILADGATAYVGSVNFTANSMDQNRELGFLTRTGQVLTSAGAAFESDWAEAEPFEGR